MKICLVTSSYPLNASDAKAAAGLFVRDFALHLAKTGHEVCVFTHARDGVVQDDPELKVWRFCCKGIDKPLARLNPFHPTDLWRMLLLLKAGRKELLCFIEEEKIDTCLALWAVPSGYFTYFAKEKSGIPYSVWALGSDIWSYGKYPIINSLLKKILLEASGLFADGIELSQKVKELAGRECEFLPSVRALPQIETKEKKPKGDSTDAREKNFIYIGRWEKNKGIDILVEAMNLAIKEGLRVKLQIFGGGTLEKKVKHQISKYGLEEDIALGGYVPPPEAVYHLSRSDYLIIPSRIESIPLIFSDALRTKIPLLVTAVGDMGVLTEKYKVGKVVPPNNAIALKNGIKELIEKDRRETYIQNMDSLLELFEMDNIVNKYLGTATAISC